MKTWLAIVFSIALFVVCWYASGVLRFNLVMPMVILTSLWAAVDSSRLQLRRYKSGISYGPVVLFFACALLWIVGFPWYLSMRHKIRNGTAVLKEAAATPTI
jgi:hypothetical protein